MYKDHTVNYLMTKDKMKEILDKIEQECSNKYNNEISSNKEEFNHEYSED